MKRKRGVQSGYEERAHQNRLPRLNAFHMGRGGRQVVQEDMPLSVLILTIATVNYLAPKRPSTCKEMAC